jgi:lysophospholipase L1-like esterase
MTHSQAHPDPTSLKIVALGASDVVGVGARHPDTEGWAPVMASLLPGPKRLMRLGLSGATAGQLRAQLLPKAIAARPDVAVVWVGVNDCARMTPLPQFQADLEAIVTGLSGAGAQVFVINLPDLDRLPALKSFALWIRAALPSWQGAVRQVAARHGATVVELTHYTTEIERRPDYLCGDGFHPSHHGYRRVAELVAEAVQARLGPAKQA